MEAGLRSKCLLTSSTIFSSGIFPVPKVSTRTDTGLRDTDRVRKLDLAFVSQTGCYDVLCRISGRVSCGTVDLCRVFAGKCRRRVSGISAVGVYDDFSACQAGVSVRSADYESSCRINVVLRLVVYEGVRNDRIDDVFDDILS